MQSINTVSLASSSSARFSRWFDEDVLTYGRLSLSRIEGHVRTQSCVCCDGPWYIKFASLWTACHTQPSSPPVPLAPYPFWIRFGWVCKILILEYDGCRIVLSQGIKTRVVGVIFGSPGEPLKLECQCSTIACPSLILRSCTHCLLVLRDQTRYALLLWSYYNSSISASFFSTFRMLIFPSSDFLAWPNCQWNWQTCAHAMQEHAWTCHDVIFQCSEAPLVRKKIKIELSRACFCSVLDSFLERSYTSK